MAVNYENTVIITIATHNGVLYTDENVQYLLDHARTMRRTGVAVFRPVLAPTNDESFCLILCAESWPSRRQRPLLIDDARLFARL